MLTTAVGDFNNDGFDDLAIATPGENFSEPLNGIVHILYGSGEALDDPDDPPDPDPDAPDDPVSPPSDIFSQDFRFGGLNQSGEDREDIDGETEPGDRFGYSLAAGDFDGDGFDDLAVGVPFEDFPDQIDAGAVNIVYGTSRGLTTRNSLFLHQDIERVNDRAESGDRFGFSLTAGDFDGDGFDDLAVGVPYEDVGRTADAGIVQVFYGSAGLGINRILDSVISQNTSGVRDTSESGDRFGYSLAAGNFNGDRNQSTDLIEDLAIGVPFEDYSGFKDAGVIAVLYGSDDGLDTGDDEFLAQGRKLTGDRILGVTEERDLFGFALTTGNINGDTVGPAATARALDELVVGVPHEDLDTTGDPGGLSLENAGGVIVIFGSADGLVGEGNQFFSQNTQEVRGTRILGQIEGESNGRDLFGYTVAVADFNGDGFGDLAVAAVRKNSRAGSVNLIFGTEDGLTAVGDQFLSGSSESAGDPEEFGSFMAVGEFNGDEFADLIVTVPGRDLDINPDPAAEDIRPDLGQALQFAGAEGTIFIDDFFDQRSIGGGVGDGEEGERFGGLGGVSDFR